MGKGVGNILSSSAVSYAITSVRYNFCAAAENLFREKKWAGRVVSLRVEDHFSAEKQLKKKRNAWFSFRFFINFVHKFAAVSVSIILSGYSMERAPLLSMRNRFKNNICFICSGFESDTAGNATLTPTSLIGLAHPAWNTVPYLWFVTTARHARNRPHRSCDCLICG